MKTLIAWIAANRATARIAFVLRIVCMAVNGLLSLVWTPLLLRALGAENFGTYAAFGALLSLATAGELGLGGATAIRTNQLIATGDLDGLRRLHAMSRTVFFAIALVGALIALGLSPWLPAWLGFQPGASAGSLPWLFAAGALSVGLSIFSSYVTNSIYAAGTVMWPVVPSFVFGQAILISSVALAWLGAPLWGLQSAAAILGVLSLGVMFLIYRHSHPVFREALPRCFDRALLRDLATTSFWSYLFGLTLLIYVATDRLVVNAFFGAGAVPTYQLNYKLCELALTLIITAGAVSLPKVVNLLLNADPHLRQQGTAQAARLAQIQGLLGFGACVAYVAGNDLFIRWLFGAEYQAPLALQVAFVTSLLMASNADIFTQLCGRMEAGGLRFSAIVLVVSALLNLALSLVAAAWLRWMPGVAWATFVAQLASFLFIAEYVRRRDGLGSRGRLFWRSLIAPMLLLALLVAGRWLIPPAWEPLGGLVLVIPGLVMVGIHARLIGLGWTDLRAETAVFGRLFGMGRSSPASGQ